MKSSIYVIVTKIHICEKCHNHLYFIFIKTEIPCQAVCNKITLDFIQDDLKDVKKLEKVSTYKRTLVRKVLIMCGKSEFLK